VAHALGIAPVGHLDEKRWTRPISLAGRAPGPDQRRRLGGTSCEAPECGQVVLATGLAAGLVHLDRVALGTEPREQASTSVARLVQVNFVSRPRWLDHVLRASHGMGKRASRVGVGCVSMRKQGAIGRDGAERTQLTERAVEQAPRQAIFEVDDQHALHRATRVLHRATSVRSVRKLFAEVWPM